jgi:hypothetical protein
VSNNETVLERKGLEGVQGIGNSRNFAASKDKKVSEEQRQR